MTTKIPLSRFTPPTAPTRPVFTRQSAVQEELLLPADESAEHESPSMQIASLFGAPAPAAGSTEPVRRPAREREPRPRRPLQFNPALSVGQQFLQSRVAQGWSIEDVAFQTRIPHTLLREMENDDLSNFANLTYAKGFLKLYSRHLGLDLSDYLEQFDTSVISDVTGHEYIQTASLVRSLSAPAIAADASGNPRVRLIGIGILAGLAALGLFIFLKFGHSAPEPAPAGRSVGASESTPASGQPARPEKGKLAFSPSSSTSSPRPADATATPPRAEIVPSAEDAPAAVVSKL